MNIHSAKKRYPTRTIQGRIGPDAIARILAKTAGRCWWCGKTLTQLSIDHVLAISLGGSDEESNLVPSCGSCNSGKSNRGVEYFHRYRCLRQAGIPIFISVRIMDWFIENDLTTFRYETNPFADGKSPWSVDS